MRSRRTTSATVRSSLRRNSSNFVEDQGPAIALDSGRQLEHAVDRLFGGEAQRLVELDARTEIAQGEVKLFERVAPHVRTLVARAALVDRRTRDKRLAGRVAAHRVQN